MPSLANPPEPSTATTISPHASISGPAYLSALSKFITTHESALAAYYAPRLRHSASNGGATNGGGGPSWGTILTLGILPDSPAAPPPSSSSRRPTPPTATPRKDPLVLQFDPHHLYYILLKFDELGLSTGDELDIKVEGGHTRPMSVDHTAAQGAGMIDIVNEGTAPTPSLLAGMFGFRGGGSGSGGSRKQDDTRSVMSGKSSFSFGSGWWGLAGGGGSTNQPQSDEPTQVRHIYSSCTKLPALKLSPFIFSPSSQRQTPSISRPPSQAVEGFEDCPPPSTCVPLSLFHSLTSLYLQDLDPRAFAGWDVLSIQLKKLEVVRGGIEDVGELICDCVVEDEARSKRKRAQEGSANETVGEGRRKRTEGSTSSGQLDESHHSIGIPTNDSYPSPSKLAWSSLRHLSLHDNSLTFLPVPPLSHLPMLTSLDLSSNLLISVPPALSTLTSLRSLNLRDNMIDNLHSLPTILGAIEVLNLSQNRLENLSGLDRLLALERLDLRGNRIYEALEVSRLARLPNLREVWIKENPFARMKEEGGEEGWRIKCLAYFEEERLSKGDPAETEEEGVRIDGRGIEGRTERKAVEAEVAKRSGGAFLPSRTMSRRASTGFGSTQGETSSGAGLGMGVAPKKVVVEPRRRVVTAPISAQSSRQRSSTAYEASPPGSLSTSPVLGGPPRPLSPSKPARRRKPKRIVDLDAPLSGGTPTVASSSTQQQSDSDATTTSSGPDGGKRAPTSLATVPEPVSSSSNSTAPATPRKQPTSNHQKFASSPSHARISPARNDFTSLGPSTSPTKSRINSRRERVSASTYEPPLGGGHGEATSSGGEGGGGGEALRRKIEKLREEVGENWLSVLGEREARALQQKQKERDKDKAGKAEPPKEEERVVQEEEEAEPRRQQSEEAVEGLAVSSGVKVVKKKGKKKKGKGK